jgi:hypothetical protein
MLKFTIFHTPNYFQFYIQDRQSVDDLQGNHYEMLKNGFGCGEGIILVSVSSEYSQIPITVEFDHNAPEPHDFAKWDRVIECSLAIQSEDIVFVGCPGGPDTDCFCALETGPGHYRLRIYYGGQDTLQLDGETNDYYRVQIWPGEQQDSRVLKP